MSAFEVYSFVLCLIVFCLLGISSAMALAHIYRLTGRLIDLGGEDEAIKTEYEKKKAPKKGAKAFAILDKVCSAFMLILLCAVFIFSLYLQSTEAKVPNGVPSLKVVKSPSMSFIHKDNKKLEENGIDNQIQAYDLILTHHLPAEEDLKIYDIVLYETEDGMFVIHRIVDIEEPNANHPDCRYFVLQGDANRVPDRIPVYYTQMRGIYYNERVPFVGSFFMFMQSPAGWLCIFYVVILSLASPVMNRALEEKKRARLAAMGLLDEGETESGGDGR